MERGAEQRERKGRRGAARKAAVWASGRASERGTTEETNPVRTRSMNRDFRWILIRRKTAIERRIDGKERGNERGERRGGDMCKDVWLLCVFGRKRTPWTSILKAFFEGIRRALEWNGAAVSAAFVGALVYCLSLFGAHSPSCCGRCLRPTYCAEGPNSQNARSSLGHRHLDHAGGADECARDGAAPGAAGGRQVRARVSLSGSLKKGRGVWRKAGEFGGRHGSLKEGRGV